MNFFEFAFMQRAIIAGCFIAIACALLGVFLVLRRLALIGDGLAHVSFGGVALGILFNVNPVWFALVIAALSSLGILKLRERAKIYGDSAIGILSSLGLAGGIVIASAVAGSNVQLVSYLFGSILTINHTDVLVAVILSLVIVLTLLLFYNDLVAIAFNEELARISGARVNALNILFVLLTAVTVALAMRVVGILLVVALMILPATASLQIAKNFKQTLGLAALCAVASVLVGLGLSYQFNLAAGGTIVIVNFVLFAIAYALRQISNRHLRTEQ